LFIARILILGAGRKLKEKFGSERRARWFGR
jgi:hypothetical protein